MTNFKSIQFIQFFKLLFCIALNNRETMHIYYTHVYDIKQDKVNKSVHYKYII